MAMKAPGPRGHFLLGSLPEFNHDLLGFLQRTHDQYGDMVRIRLAHKVGHLLCHPALAEHVLITPGEDIVKYSQVGRQRGLSLFMGDGLIMNYGDSWRRQRDLINPMFRPKVIEELAKTMIQCGEHLIARLHQYAATNQVADIWREVYQSALEAALATLFSAPPSDSCDEIREAITFVLRYCTESRYSPLMPPPSWPTARNRKFHAARKVIDDHVNALIQDRMTNGSKHADFLGLLLDATYKDSGEKMSPAQVRDEAVTMLGAGHETSASALTWALVQIARHPEVAEKMRAEIERVVGDGPLHFGHLRQLKYVQAVVQETLRLCAPVPLFPRATLRKTQVGGYEIPERSMLFISVYNIHRHKDFWRDPEQFEPDRFYKDDGLKQKHRCVFIPFGAGERFCIGSNFASVELSIFLTQILGAFDIRLVDDHIPTEVAITMRPSMPVYVQLQAIQPKRAMVAARA